MLTQTMSMIRAKWMKAVNMMSSFSKREKMRRKPFEPAEQALDLVAPAIEAAVVGPGVEAAGGVEAELQHQLAGLVAFVGSVHHHRAAAASASAACVLRGRRGPARAHGAKVRAIRSFAATR